MSKTIVVCGYGPGISAAVARKFGGEGYQVALVARNAERLDAGVKALTEAGVKAQAFCCDLADLDAVANMIGAVQASLGPIHTIVWNAYAGGAGDLLTAGADELHRTLDVSVVGAVVAVQRSLDDLRANKGAVIITGGGFAFYEDAPTKMAIDYNCMGLALGKAAQHKLTGLLHHKLAGDGVFVGSVVVLGLVKGTAFSAEQGLDADDIAAAMWTLAHERNAIYVRFSG